MISFSDQSLGFRRHPLQLKASIVPNGTIRFTVLRGLPGTERDEQCHIVDGRLEVVATGGDIRAPSLPTVCLIEAYSLPFTGRAAAKRQRALVTIGYPTFNVSVDPVLPVDWTTTKEIVVHVHETSGATYTMRVVGSCGSGRSPLEGTSAPDTHEYTITIPLEDPGSAPRTCEMRAVAGPQDIAGGKDSDEFTVVVNP